MEASETSSWGAPVPDRVAIHRTDRIGPEKFRSVRLRRTLTENRLPLIDLLARLEKPKMARRLLIGEDPEAECCPSCQNESLSVREWVREFDARIGEIQAVASDDGQTMHQRSRRNQAVLNRHGLARFSKVRQQLGPV